jgi:hypothetical protein
MAFSWDLASNRFISLLHSTTLDGVLLVLWLDCFSKLAKSVLGFIGAWNIDEKS